MSRIGKLAVLIPQSVSIDLLGINGLNVNVKGVKGSLSKLFSGNIAITIQEKDNNKLFVKPLDNSKSTRSLWGTARSIIYNMVKGVNEGFVKELEVSGIGYRASIKGSYLNLLLGKSHSTKIEIPDYIKINVLKQNTLVLESIDKERLGQFVSMIIKQRPPEPYKGKGIKLKGQYIQRKEGKRN